MSVHPRHWVMLGFTCVPMQRMCHKSGRAIHFVHPSRHIISLARAA